MPETLRIALAQINPHEGEVEKNAARTVSYTHLTLPTTERV